MKMPSARTMLASSVVAAALAGGAAIAQQSATSQGVPNQQPVPSNHANSIQPETTLSVSASGEVSRAPDIATITAGVETEAETASAAMSQNAASMDGVYSALEAAGGRTVRSLADIGAALTDVTGW